ncbi:MAG: hypothetical protein CMO10_05345 [Thalassospira sp.]|nr:hypothetical protein [Thalassospira sp.]|tara:strand:- start:2624 stop:2881 length:258 start_codon:yes stop_codon:yes gene_type:complete
MVEIGKMTTAIEGLQDKVDKLDANDRKIQSGISQIKGGLIVAGIALGFLGWLFSDQISALRTTIVSAPAPTQQAPAQPPAPQPKP